MTLKWVSNTAPSLLNGSAMAELGVLKNQDLGMTNETFEKERSFRDRKEHRQEEHYKHSRAVPYKREPLKLDELLEEDQDDE